MKTIQVMIEEHITQTFEIVANDMGEAMDIAITRYKAGDLVLDNSEVQTTLIAAHDSEAHEYTEWSEI